ncbi:MAG: hypothetical protein ACRDNS_21805 [Trebonia sp.]
MLDQLDVDALGAEQAEQADVGGRDQDRPPASPAGTQDVVPQDIGIDHDQRPDTPLASDVKDMIAGQLNKAEERFAAISG